MIRNGGMIGRTYRYINRYREIITVLIKYGFADIIARSKLETVIDFGRKLVYKNPDKTVLKLSRWERIRLVLEELGPTFIKLGQVMSTRPDLIPVALITELEKLQDSVKPFPSDIATGVVEKELEEPIGNVFLHFEKEPVAAASVAQVHRATLLDGTEVIVKIQRPGIHRIIETDLDIMFHLAAMLEKHVAESRYFNVVKIVEEFERAIRKELNFRLEGSNIEHFASIFRQDKTIYVPQYYREYSTQKVLTMEYIPGIKISDIDSLHTGGLDPKIIADRGSDLVLKQIFDFGFFHADPHPGNIMVLPENVICFLDYGMMGYLTRSGRELILSIMTGAIQNDVDRVIRSILRMCESKGVVNKAEMERQITEIIDRYFFLSLNQIDIKSLINDIISFFPDNNLALPADLYLLGRALLLLQSAGEKLDPGFNVAEKIRPYLKKLLRERVKISKLSREMYASLEESSLLLKDIPFEIRDLIDNIKKEKVHLDLRHQGLENLITSNQQISNRISFAIVLAAIIIGSSLITYTEIPPLYKGIPVIGMVGFIVSGLMGFWLLISIIRHGRM